MYVIYETIWNVIFICIHTKVQNKFVYFTKKSTFIITKNLLKFLPLDQTSIIYPTLKCKTWFLRSFDQITSLGIFWISTFAFLIVIIVDIISTFGNHGASAFTLFFSRQNKVFQYVALISALKFSEKLQDKVWFIYDKYIQK